MHRTRPLRVNMKGTVGQVWKAGLFCDGREWDVFTSKWQHCPKKVHLSFPKTWPNQSVFWFCSGMKTSAGKATITKRHKTEMSGEMFSKSQEKHVSGQKSTTALRDKNNPCGWQKRELVCDVASCIALSISVESNGNSNEKDIWTG